MGKLAAKLAELTQRVSDLEAKIALHGHKRHFWEGTVDRSRQRIKLSPRCRSGCRA